MRNGVNDVVWKCAAVEFGRTGNWRGWGVREGGGRGLKWQKL